MACEWQHRQYALLRILVVTYLDAFAHPFAAETAVLGVVWTGLVSPRLMDWYLRLLHAAALLFNQNCPPQFIRGRDGVCLGCRTAGHGGY